MTRMGVLFAVLIALMGVTPGVSRQASAGEAGTLTRQFLESGALEEGERTLAARAEASGDAEARFGLAMIRFARAIETFGRHHYRYGLRPAVLDAFPFLRMPLPANPQAERLTYEAQRAGLQRFADDLGAVEATLAALGPGEMKIVLDLERVRLNLTGTPEGAGATLMSILRAAAFTSPLDESSVSNLPAAPGSTAVPGAPGALPPSPPTFEVAFDRGDAFWLKGYCRLLTAALETILAYDWSVTFARTAGMFYPNLAEEPQSAQSSFDAMIGQPGSASLIAESIALIHEVRWPVAEPARLPRAREKLKGVVAASRESWEAILAETDDDREWIAAPVQKNGAMPRMVITQERLDVWLAALADFDAMLDGRKLLPHWRMEKGINLKRVFEEPRPFDFVLWMTGHAAQPYLEDGPVISPEARQLWQQVFAGDFLLFVFYLN